MSRLLFEARAAVLACEAQQALIEKEIELEKLKQQRKPLTDEQQIAEALRRHGLTLVKTAKGYDVMSLGHITAHGIKENT